MERLLETFYQGIRSHSLLSVSGKAFVRTRRLKLWLNSTDESAGEKTETILESLFNTVVVNSVSRHPITTPWDSDTVLIFSILRQLGQANLLPEIIENGISDKSLPLTKDDLRVLSLQIDVDTFFEMQWQYCGATFELDGDYEWPEDMVIPICSQNLMAEGRTAKIYEVAVPREFLGPKLAHAFWYCRYKGSDADVESVLESSFPHSETEFDDADQFYRFALKTFDKWDAELGRREIAVWQHLKSNKGFVRPLAAFKSRENRSSSELEKTNDAKESYNILFEWCEMDLGIYFESKNAPVMSQDIELFWTNLSRLAETLEQLHGASHKADLEFEASTGYVGYHHDIKPSNILWSEGRFKLSDFGFAYFGPLDGATAPPASYGTISYGPPAPNIYTTSHQTLPGFQKFDLWSLGCVFSEAATWVVLGNFGIQSFRNLRRQNLERLCAEHVKKPPKTDTKRSVDIPRRGDYFHDGTDVLAAVTTWHRFLRSSVRRSDAITSKVLDIVDQGLLVSEVEERLDAKTLYARLKQVITEGREEAGSFPNIDTEIEVFLREEESKDAEEDIVDEGY